MSSSAEHSSPILVVGLAGRIGSGTSFVGDKIRQGLSSYGYEIETVDVSDAVLGNAFEHVRESLERELDFTIDVPEDRFEGHAKRVRQLQINGNALRKIDLACIAMYVTRVIIQRNLDDRRARKKSARVAYIVDSLKHPEEVRYLRRAFGPAFYLVGVVASDACRYRRLHERKGFDADTFSIISSIDGDEKTEIGQKAIRTVIESDYFIENMYSTKDEIATATSRFLRLVFQTSVVTPTVDEYGMGAAFLSSYRSACLSRQVGAAIFSSFGDLVATGTNDAPQFNGGLYNCDSPQGDNRCWSKGAKCYNDAEKADIAHTLASEIVRSVPACADSADSLAEIILRSRVRELIEFSRAVHAEMDAIVAASRMGSAGLRGSTLYCTTYPCHNCAKHIIAAGIIRVVYLEPYEKSLARELHSDEIEDPNHGGAQDRVKFSLYSGVSPRRFDGYFKTNGLRKQNGRYVDRDRERESLLPVFAEPQALSRYRLECATNSGMEEQTND